MPTFPTGTGYIVLPVRHSTGVATWLWALALRVGTIGWHPSVDGGDSASDIMEDAMDECGLVW